MHVNWTKIKSELRQKLTWKEFKQSLTILNVLNALFLFIVVVSGAILVMVMIKMISIDDAVVRELWLEVNTQILNGMFTIMALILLPFRLTLAYWTIRYYRASSRDKTEWAKKIEKMAPGVVLVDPSSVSTDTINLQPALNEPLDSVDGRSNNQKKKGTLLQEWTWIIILLNGQCIFQIPVTIVHWMWFNQSNLRPKWIIGLFLPASFLCMVISGIWLYKVTHKYESTTDSIELNIVQVEDNT